MAINKVIYQDDVLMDVTDSTVTPMTLGEGVVAYMANGERIVGENTGIAVAGGGIIDVLELPNTDIKKDAFYRLMTANLIWNQSDQREYDRHCICVNSLPSTGLPVTANMGDMLVYYSIADGDVFGYVTDTIGASAGVPAGWYTLATLAPLFDVTWSGVITNITDDPCDDSFRILLGYDFYIYQNEWIKTIMAYEKAPKFDIQWDGDMTDRIALDMSLSGYNPGTYFVKVGEDVLATDEVIGGTVNVKFGNGSYDKTVIEDYHIDTTTYPGAFTINNFMVVVHDDTALAAALGIPAGVYTNGIYFWTYNGDEHPDDVGHVSRFVAPPTITKIPDKYIDSSFFDTLAPVAISGDYNDLYNRPDVYSKSEVDNKIANTGGGVDVNTVETMINNAIGSAIGGSY